MANKEHLNVRLQMDHPCKHLFLRPLFHIILNVSQDCMVLKVRILHNFAPAAEPQLITTSGKYVHWSQPRRIMGTVSQYGAYGKTIVTLGRFNKSYSYLVWSKTAQYHYDDVFEVSKTSIIITSENFTFGTKIKQTETLLILLLPPVFLSHWQRKKNSHPLV